MEDKPSAVTPERFATGMTFDQYIAYVGTPENLKRDGSQAEARDSNADLMAEFLNVKNGQAWQSIPVVAFYTKTLEYLYHYVEYPAIYHKDRVVGHLRAPRPGETPEKTQTRGTRLFFELLDSPFFHVWQCAAVDEMLSMLHERLVVGALAYRQGGGDGGGTPVLGRRRRRDGDAEPSGEAERAEPRGARGPGPRL